MNSMCFFSIFDVQLQNHRGVKPPKVSRFFGVLDLKMCSNQKSHVRFFFEVLIQWEIFKTVKIKIIPFGSMFS